MNFNPQQEAAYLCDKPCSLVSTAGSGKTAVTTQKAVRLLKESTNNHIIMVTFTRASARSLRERILGLYPEAEDRITVGTFHALAIRQLFLGRQAVNLIGQFEQSNLLKRVHEEHASDYTLDEVVEAIELAQSGSVAIINKNPEIKAAYEAYLAKLENHSVTDLNSIIKTATLKMKSSDIAPLPGTHIFVDEFQDIDVVQLRWLFCHIEAGLVPMVVGDDDQSIYGFRRSLGYKAIVEYERFAKAKRLIMEINYRCSSNIIALAERLINHNTERVPKNLKAHKEDVGFIGYKLFGCEEGEGWCIADTVRDNPKDWAIIARSNPRLERIIPMLVERNIPYRKIGESSFWDTPIPSAILSLAKHLVKYNLIGLESVMSYAGFPAAIVSEYHNYRKRTSKGRLNGDFLIKCKKFFSSESLVKVEDIVRFDLMVEQSVKLYRGGDLHEALDKIGNWVTSIEKNRTTEAKKFFKKERLVKSAIKAIKGQKGTLKQRLLKLLQAKNDSRDGVVLMTAHGSKGLEFKKVWVAGVEDDTFPHSRLATSVEEERRLLFVAVTRAEECLIVSSVEDESRKKYASRFVWEMGLIKHEAQN